MPDKERIKSIISKVRGLGRSGVSYVRDKVSSLLDDARETAGKIVEAAHADVYPGKEYTFEEAYKDARSRGQRTFFWKGKYYNTDYEGEHGRQYRRDVESGKAAAWEEAYPNFTNPELRREKQEELDTYGITNEQTKNKTRRDELFVKIPARGYNVSDAISSIIGEHTSYSKYKSAEDMIDGIRAKYGHKFDSLPLKPATNNFDGGIAVSYNSDDVFALRDGLKTESEKRKFDSFIADLDNISAYTWGYPLRDEIHRNEYNLLLGYPMEGDTNGSPLPVISKYRTGSAPYYYTTGIVENSTPFFPERLMDAIKKDNEKLGGLSPAEYEKLYTDSEKFYDRVIGNRDYYEGIGIYPHKGAIKIDDVGKFLANATSDDWRNMHNILGFAYMNQAPVDDATPGNYLSNTGQENYYLYNDNYEDSGKYDAWINGALELIRGKNAVEDPNKYGVITKENKVKNADEWMINSTPSLGTFTLGIPQGKDFISVYDMFDIDPFGSGNDKPIIRIGKPFEYYTRFYPEGKTPDIDALYRDFEFAGGGPIHKYNNNLYWPGGPISLAPYIPTVVAKGYRMLKGVLNGDLENQKKIAEKYHDVSEKLPDDINIAAYRAAKEAATDGTGIRGMLKGFIPNLKEVKSASPGKEPYTDEAFLLSPERQRKFLESLGYTRDTSGDYGLVSSAVNRYRQATGRDVPVYVYGNNDAPREDLIPLRHPVLQSRDTFGNIDVSIDKFDEKDAIGDRTDFPMRLYRDRDGVLYVKEWDFLDHGGYSHGPRGADADIYRTKSLTDSIERYGDLMDVAGNPFVRSTGYQRVTDFSLPYAYHILDNEVPNDRNSGYDYDLIKERILNGEFDIKANGGKIHIKPSHRGRLTELKKRTGKTEAELYNDGNPDHRRMIVFARNSRKWDHADGGFLHKYDGETEETQQMIVKRPPNAPLEYLNGDELDRATKAYRDGRMNGFDVPDGWFKPYYSMLGNDVANYFNSYAYSPGIDRIIKNQNEYLKNAGLDKWGQFGGDTAEDVKSGIRKNLINPKDIVFNEAGFSDSGFHYSRNDAYNNEPGISVIGSLPGSYPLPFVTTHEVAHGIGSYRQAPLQENRNTIYNGHDELGSEKHADLEGLRYMLFNEGIYDSRGEEDATPEHIKQLREKYPDLRPLQQMDDEKAAFMINNVAANTRGVNPNIASAGGQIHTYDGETEDTQKMNIMKDDVQYYDPTDILSQYVDIARRPGERWRDYRNWLKDLAYNTAYGVAGGIEGGYNDPSSLSGRKRDIRRFERWYDKAVAQKAAEDREMELWRKNADGSITPEEFGELSSPRVATISKALFSDPGTLQGLANGSIASAGLILGGGALKGALQNPAAVGNALQYMQPSKWLEMGLKPALGSAPYYSGALTGAGALADLAWDSYGIYEGVKNAGKTGSLPGEILNTMNFIPGAVGLAQGAGRAYRAVSNAAHGIREFARNPLHINTSLSDISGLDGLAGVEEKPIAELYANLDEAIRAYDSGQRDRIAAQIRDRLRRSSLNGLATGDAYLSSDRYLMDVVNDNAIVNPDVNLGLNMRDNGFINRDELRNMAADELFRRIEGGEIDGTGYSIEDLSRLEIALERMRQMGRYDDGKLDDGLYNIDNEIRSAIRTALRSGQELPDDVTTTSRFQDEVDGLLSSGELGVDDPNVRRLVDRYNARRTGSSSEIFEREAARRGARNYARDESTGYRYTDIDGTVIPDSPIRSVRDLARKEGVEKLFKDAGIGDIDSGVIYNPAHPDYLRASEALRKHGAYDLPADVDHMYWFNVRDAYEDYIRLSDELARLEKNVSEGKTLTQSEEARLKELKETLLPNARAKVSQSRKYVLEHTNKLISSAPRGTGIKEHNTSTDSYRLMLRGAERAPGGYGYGPNQASVLVHKNPDGTPIMYNGNSMQLNRAMFAPDGSLRLMEGNESLAGLLTKKEVEEIRNVLWGKSTFEAMDEIQSDPHKLDIAKRMIRLAYTLNKQDHDSIAQSISRINSRYGENIPMPELTIQENFTGNPADDAYLLDVIARGLLSSDGYAPVLKRPMITVVKHKYGGRIGATMQQDNYDKIMSAINKVKAGRK